MKKLFHPLIQKIAICDSFVDKITNFFYAEFYEYNDNKLEKNSSNDVKFKEQKKNHHKRKIRKNIYWFFLLILWGLLISTISIWKSCNILCCIGFLGLGWSLILYSYNIFRENLYRMVLFGSVLLIGFFLYGVYDSYGKVDKNSTKEAIIYVINDVNNVLSSFFPSRGDTVINELNEKLDCKKTNVQKEKGNLKPVICIYVLYHCIAYMTIGILTMSLWGRRLANYLKSATTLDKNKYVFWGQELDDRCLILGQDIYNNRLHSEIIISLFDDRVANYIDEYRLYDTLNRKDLMLRIYDADSFPYDNLYAPHHFFISNDEAWNMKGCIKLLEERKKYNINNEVNLYIRLGEGEKCNIYEKILDSLSQTDKEQIFANIHIHVFNESELIARHFVETYPMLLAPYVKNNINHDTAKLKSGTKMKILLLGFGWQGKQLLSKIVESSQFLIEGQDDFKSPLSVDIWDKNLEAFDQYKALRQDACKKYNLEFDVCDVMTSAFISKMANLLESYDRIIITLGEDSLNLEAYSLIQKLRRIHNCQKHLEVFVKQNYLPLEQLQQYICKLEDSNLFNNVFGTMSSIYTNDIILDENTDLMAKYLHVFYKKKYEQNESQKKGDEVMVDKAIFLKELNEIIQSKNKIFNDIKKEDVKNEWQKTSLYDKQSSYSQATGLKNILYLLGFERINNENSTNDNKLITQKPNKENDESDKLKNKLLDNNKEMKHGEQCIKDNLAQIEHIRWEAYMLMQGIKPWKIDENTSCEDALINDFKASQVKTKCRHAALVDWDKLPTVDKLLLKLSLEYKQKNKKIDEIQTSPAQTQDSKEEFISALQTYDYNVNLLPLILEKADIKIQRLVKPNVQ